MDNYDVLMNVKRQATGTNTNTSATTGAPATTPSATASPSATSTPATTRTPTPTATPTPTPTPTPSSASTPSTSSTPAATSSSAAQSTSSQPSTTPSSTASSTPSSTPRSTASSTLVTSLTPTSSPTTAAPSSSPSLGTTSRTTLSVAAGTTSYIRTTSNGVVLTATIVIGQPSASASAAAAKTPFFKNTGAVVGVFVVVGIAATALLVLIFTMFLRRRRAKQFDRDVQEAAREAAQTQAPIDDDDYTQGTSYNTHASQPMSTERPGPGVGVGYAGASSWDPYGRAPGGFEMQHRRTSTGTAPGMAGFGAGDAFARAVGVDPPQGYNSNQAYGPAYGQQGYNNQAPQGYQTYNNTSPPPPQPYAQPQGQGQGQGRAPVQAQMMIPEPQRQNYNTVGAYRSSPSYGEAHPGEHVEYGHADTSGYARGDNSGYGYAYGGERSQEGGSQPTSGPAPNQPAATRMPVEDAYGGYEAYDAYSAPVAGNSGGSTSHSSGGPPAYVSGAGSSRAMGDRKNSGGPGQAQGASVGRQPSGKSAVTQYSQDLGEDSDGSVYERPERRVLKVANE